MPKRKKKQLDLKKIFAVNRLVKFFILSDFMFLGGWGLVAPVFAIFVIRDVVGATIVTVGAAASVYWFTKALVQLPVALYIDKKKGERDDFHALIFALILSGFASLSFLVVDTVPLLFLVVFLKAVAFGFYTPSWAAIFSRHLDKKRYAFDWSLDNAMIAISSGVAGLLGGFLASVFGFQAVFIFAGALSFGSVMLLLTVPHLVLPQPVSKKKLIRDHTVSNIHH